MNLEPATTAAAAPDRPAVVTSSGAVVTYAELEARSRRLARELANLGLEAGGHVALVVGNDARAHEVLWAVHRSGFVYTPVNPMLTPDEAAYIVSDCGAEVIVANGRGAGLAAAVQPLVPAAHVVVVDGDAAGDGPLEDRLPSEQEGVAMTYSSGTTGRPKGTLRTPPGLALGSVNPLSIYFDRMGVTAGSVFIVPAPVFHTAPLYWSMALHRVGATCVLMESFDARTCLELMTRHRVTHGLFVPTMFVRLLKLADEERAAFDASALQTVVHAAAPCPVEVKRRMIEWWGPVIDEFYGASEGGGTTYITAEEWLAHPGSVGRSFYGVAHVCGDDGTELAVGEEGVIWFEGGAPIAYHNNPEASAQVVDERGWVTFWDVGRLDADGYLYLTDRKQFMIVSGGVNIYPQEIEDALVLHPAVLDCAVFGVPNAEYGEEVKAVVQPADPSCDRDALAAELIEFCRDRLAHYKAPRSVDFVDALPREDTGKLYKRRLRDEHWRDHGSSRIV